MPDDIKIQVPAEPGPSVRKGLPYGILKQTHKQYDAGLLEKIEDLYVGGFQILDKADKYLTKLVNEHEQRYDERCSVTSYQPYFAQIVDQFVSDVFGQPLSIKPAADAANPNTPGEVPDKDFYSEFEKDCDREGTPFADLMEVTLRTALKKRCALVAVDAPPTDGAPPTSRAEEEARGTARLYAYELPLEQLIDWKCLPGGKGFVWAILNKCERERETPFDTREVTTETFTLWTMNDGVPGEATAHWQRYVVRYKDDEAPKPEDNIPLADEGDSSFHVIPLLRFEVPEGLWVGNKIGTQALEHYQRRSTLVSAENRSMVAIPYVKKGPQAPAVGGAIPADVVQNPHRGNNPVGRFTKEGWTELGSEDEIGFAEPEGKCYELVDKQLDALKDGMFAVNHQMAASIKPTGAALGRSGLSKQKDQDATARVLRALGHLVRQFAVRVYDTISKARKEDTHWAPYGLDAYEHEDREATLEEAVSLDQVAIPSVTFRKLHKRMVAEKLLRGIDPETLSTVIQEIEQGVEDEDEMRTLQTEAQKDALENPPAPVAPGVKTPAVKSPKAEPPTTPAVGDKAA